MNRRDTHTVTCGASLLTVLHIVGHLYYITHEKPEPGPDKNFAQALHDAQTTQLALSVPKDTASQLAQDQKFAELWKIYSASAYTSMSDRF